MPRVLVTGATGFIGTHLVRRLCDVGEDVVCLVRATSNRSSLEPLGVTLVEGDVGDAPSLRRAVDGCDVVYHLAGLTMALSKSEFHRVNEGGARNVAAACAAVPTPPVLISVSSIAAAGPATRGRLCLESDAPAPVSHYGRSKLAGERAVADFADRVPITIVRPPIVFGQGDRSSLPVFASVQRFGLHLSPLWRPRPFSFIHAADLATALVAAARAGRRLAYDRAPPVDECDVERSIGVYYAADDEVVTYAEFGRRVGRALGVARTTVIPNAAPAVWLAALGSEIVAHLRRRPMIFSFDKAREAVAGSWACSSDAFVRDTSWRPAKTLDERLAETAEWYQDRGWLPRPGLLARLARR